MAVIDKAALSPEVDSQFKVVSETFIDRNDMDLLSQVGDFRTPDKFIPQLKVTPFWNKAKFSVRARVDLNKPATVNTFGDRIVWEQDDRKVEFYKTTDPDMPEGVWKLDEIIETKGPSNRIPYSIRFRNVVFYKQHSMQTKYEDNPESYPEVVRCDELHMYDKDDLIIGEMPDWAVNSYALYHSHKRHNEYKTGKFLHIKRPRIIDAKGVEVWGDLNIDVEAELLEVIVPVNFWENATYPLIIDPDFGKLTVGASNFTLSANSISGSAYSMNPEDGNAISFNMHLASGGANVKGIIADSVGDIITNGITDPGLASGAGWHTFSFNPTAGLTSGSLYQIGGIPDGSGAKFSLDWGASGDGFSDNNNYANPVNMGTTVTRQWGASMYVNYEVAGGGIQNNPVGITTSAKNSVDHGVLPSQAGVPANQILFSDSFAATNNSSVAGPPTDGTPVYSGRWIIVRPGASDQEIHYMEAEVSSVQARLSEDQTVQVVAGDAYRIAYGDTDADTAGVNFKEILDPETLTIRPTDWGVATQFIIDPALASPANLKALFAMGQGSSLQTDTVGSVADARIKVANNGELIIGQFNFGIPFSGADFISLAPANGDYFIGGDVGSKIWLFDCYLKSFRRTKSFFLGESWWKRVKWFSSGETLDVTGTVEIGADCVVQGKSQATELMTFSATTNCIGPLSLINTGGLNSANDSVVETLIVRRTIFAGNVKNITVFAKKWWRLIGCTVSFDPSTQDEFSFPVNDANRITIEHFLDVTVSTITGTPVVGAKVFLYEGLRTGLVVIDGDTLAGGVYSGDFVEDDITYATPTTLTVQSDGDHTLKVYAFGFSPFIGAKGLNSNSESVGFVTDSDILAVDAATALTNGAGIALTNPVNALSIVEWAGGTGTLAVGDTVSGASATGVVVEILEGDSVAGKAILDTRNASAYVSVEGVSNGTGWTGTLVDIAGSPEKRYAWRLDCNSKSLQINYDFQAAKFSESTLDAIWKSGVAWGEGEHALLLQKSGVNYITERNVNKTEGVILTNRGVGTIGYMTADDGFQYVPPTSTIVKFDGMKDNSEVRIYNTGTSTEIAGIEDATDGTTDNRSFTWSSSASTVVDYVIHCFQPADEIYETIRITGYTVPTSDVTLPISQRLDRNAEN